MKKIVLSIALILLFLVSGCGYTTRSMIANKYRTIYVTPFVNKTDITSEANSGSKYRLYRPHLETDITKYVVDKFLFDGNLKPVKVDQADVILKGELIDFRKDPVRYDNNDNVTEYRVNLVVNISLWDAKEDRMIWQEESFTGDTSYFTTGTNAISEGTAINNALADLARRVVERAVEQW